MATAICTMFPMGNPGTGPMYQYQVDFFGEGIPEPTSDTFEVQFEDTDTVETFREKILDLAMLRAAIYNFTILPERVFIQTQYA